MSDHEGKDLFRRADEFLGLFRKGAEFTRELLEENERLRRRLSDVEERQQYAAQDSGEWEKLREELLSRVRTLESEKMDVMERLKAVEEENRQFASRYVEIEEENNNLANLYVSSYQLHSTLDLSEVLKIILEIVINLIGAETFAVYVLDEKSRQLEPVAAEGEELAAFPRMALGEGVVGEAVASGDTWCGEPAPSSDYGRPIVCIPLRVEERPIGAISIYKLLQQKDGFSPLDHELFTLLAGHAATSIFAAQLYGQSERKLNTIQGFIDLLTK
ncbi:MAG: GAF domain-containing protein [Gemmatimonadota bacterium]|nr:GAF domain-containing protein [Gemmatimonadota bacterium]